MYRLADLLWYKSLVAVMVKWAAVCLKDLLELSGQSTTVWLLGW